MRSVESQRAQAVAMVKLFKLRTAKFSSEAKLMLANGVRDDVSEVASNIFAALRRRLADTIEAGDGDVRSPRQTGGVEIRRKIQAVRRNLEAVVFIIENLAKIIDAGEDLVRDARRKDGVPRNGVVGNVDGCDLIVILQLRSCFRQSRAADRSDLVALSHEVVNGEGVLIVDFVIELGESVVAVTKFGIGTGVVVSSGWSC